MLERSIVSLMYSSCGVDFFFFFFFAFNAGNSTTLTVRLAPP